MVSYDDVVVTQKGFLFLFVFTLLRKTVILSPRSNMAAEAESSHLAAARVCSAASWPSAVTLRMRLVATSVKTAPDPPHPPDRTTTRAFILPPSPVMHCDRLTAGV